MRDNDPDGLVNCIKRFLEWMGMQGYSPHTIHARRELLGKFLRWCQERAITAPAEVSKAIIERYQSHLCYYRIAKTNQPLSSGRRKCLLVAVARFFAWLAHNGYLLYNPACDIELPKIPKRLPRHVLTWREVELIFNQPNIATPLGIRDRAILETFYSTGIRRLECTRLAISDVYFDSGVIMVKGKGNKDRYIPIGTRALLWIERYLNEVRPGLRPEPGCEIVFLNQYGNPYDAGGIGGLVTSYIRAANIGKTGSCHLFRHTMATTMLENGADIRYIKEILGHSELSTTEIYTKVSIGKLKEIHTQTHPAKMKPSKTNHPIGEGEEENN